MRAIMATPSRNHAINSAYIGGLKRELNEFERDLAKTFLLRLGRGFVMDITRRIRLQQTPDGGRQRQNSPSTFMWKQHRGVRPNIPLHDTGILINPHNYRINLAMAGRGVEVALPASRTVVANELEQRGYFFFGLPNNQGVARVINEVMDEMPAQQWFDLLDIFTVR